MTWHCPSWAQHARDNHNDIDTSGITAEDLYDEWRCTRFDSSVSITVDEHDQEQYRDETESAYCSEHDREAEWDASYDLHDDLDNQSEYVSYCHHCSLWFDINDFEEHNETEHDEAEEEDETPTSFGSLRSLWTYVQP